MSPTPADLVSAVASEIERLRAAATLRYGEALIEVGRAGDGWRGTVALPSQAVEFRTRLEAIWPGARCSLLVLAERRARLALYPDGPPLDVWRHRPDGDTEPAELTTQLLPGDPPAALLAVREGQFLVRAPGQAVGWVGRSARFRWGPALAEADPGVLAVPESGWPIESVRATALALLGRPYVFGGTGGQGVDCSGLVWRAYLAAGVLLPRNSRAQRQVGERIRIAGLREADLICAVHRGPRRTSHIAIYLGGDEVVHACSECHEVRREPLAEFRERYQVLTVRRVPGALAR
ncbi:MAG TPA: C40 family peptidase [Candidatus Dormibacteraeota bacterium]